MYDRGNFDRRTQSLFALGQLLASGGFGGGVFVLMLLDPGFGRVNLVPPIIGVLGGASAWLIIRRGQERRGAWVLLVSALMAVTGAMMSMGGFSGQSPTIFVWPVLVAGLLLGRRYAFLAAAAASLVQIILGGAELEGLYAPALTPLDTNLRVLAVGVPVVIFWLVALLSWLSAKHLGTALDSNAAVLDHAEQQLGPVANDLASGMEQLLHSADGVGQQARQLSRGAEKQALHADSGRGSAQSVADTTHALGERARQAQGATEEARRLLEDSLKVFRSLTQRVDGIGQVIEAVRNLAEKTDILALNASLEAVRAGTQGAGFALVAEQVRQSAEMSGQAAEEISSLSQAIEADLALVTHSVDRVREAITTSADLATATVAAMGEQESSSEEIVDALTALSGSAAEATRAADLIVRAVDEQSRAVVAANDSAATVATLVEAIQRRAVS